MKDLIIILGGKEMNINNVAKLVESRPPHKRTDKGGSYSNEDNLLLTTLYYHLDRKMDTPTLVCQIAEFIIKSANEKDKLKYQLEENKKQILHLTEIKELWEMRVAIIEKEIFDKYSIIEEVKASVPHSGLSWKEQHQFNLEQADRLRTKGMNKTEISRELKVSRQTVTNWLRELGRK